MGHLPQHRLISINAWRQSRASKRNGPSSWWSNELEAHHLFLVAFGVILGAVFGAWALLLRPVSVQVAWSEPDVAVQSSVSAPLRRASN